MKSFEIKITGNAKSLVDSIKSSQSAMDALIKGIDKADKKLEVLTQTGNHLSDIDKQLAKLKTDYPDIFEKIFPNIDSQINESMKPILQMPELVEQAMTKVVQKMKAIDNGSLKATDDDIKELGNDMRILGETLHLENLDMSFLDGTAKAETKIKKLIDTMSKLVEAYYNVNKAATSVDMGEVVPKKKTQKKSKNEDKPELTVNALRKKVEEIKSLSEKALDNDDAFDLVDKKTQSLIKMFKVSDDIAAKLEVELQDVDKSIEETMSKLEKMLGNQFPKAMGNAADVADDVGKKIQKLLPTSEGLEKLRIIPDGDQKAKISEYAEEYRIILKLLQQGNIESKETISALRERARTLKNIIQGVNPGDTTLDKLLTDGYGISKGTANTVASSKLSSKFKIDEFKPENISNDARQEAIDLIYHEISAENQLVKKKEEAVLSYDRLIKAVERYYELQSKLDSATDSDEFDKIADEADKIADRFAEMNNASSGVFDAIQDGLGKDEALKQLADIFGIKIPEATKKAESGIKDVTSALSETSDGLAKIMYHRGNLLDSKSRMRDSFEQMPDNLTKAVENDERWKSLGFGIFGGGLFGVANPSMINGDFSKLNGSTFIQSIDLSKYNMYMADTEERAANLAKFLSQLQKFSIKREVPDFTGFDTELSGVSEESLYKQFQGVFDATDMTKEKFLAFISEMRGLLQEAGIEFDKDLNELIFKNKDSSILSSDNISTRLLKQLGYQGVYTGETSYGGFGQGSVLFDFDVTDIIGYFNTVEQATQDFQNSLKNGWTGSNEQLRQYLSNIEEISARIEVIKAKQLNFNPDFDVSAYDNTLNALNSVKENIQKVLSGESITTDSGKISGEFKTITNSAQEATSAVEGTGTAIENTGATGSSIEGLNDGVEKAKRTLEEFRVLQDEILGKSASVEGGSMDGEAIGRYTERVETAKAKLDELAKQSLLTADQIKEANDIYETAIGNLEGKRRTNKEYYDNLAENTGREPAGSYDSGYDSGYDKGYNDAYNNARADVEDELESLRTQLAEARADLSRTQTSIDSGTPIDTSVELQNLEKLRAKLEEVKNAIIAKNKTFNDEGTIVGQVVGKEIRTLDLLLNKINDITNAINTKTESFQTEGNVVSESVKQAAKHKENNKVSNTPTSTFTPTLTKTTISSQKESFNDLLRLQKKYYGAQEALENASTSKKKSAIRKNRDELKKQYEEQLKNAKLTAEQQAKLDEKTEDHNRKIALIRANNEDKADKNANAQNEKQVNEIYQRREDIISEIIKRQKELNSVATEEGKAAAEDALNAATDKLRQINEEIDNSGLVFDDKKLSAQNDKLANSIANANKSNFIKEQEGVGKEKIAQQKKDFEELLALQKKYYDTQKALENGVGTVKEEELVRKATEAEDLYNKKKQEVKLTQEQENQLLEKQAELARELAGVKTDKETTSAAVTAKAKQDGILNAIKQEVSKSYKSTGISVLDDVPEELTNTKTAYDALIDKINDYKLKGVALSDDIINGLKEEAKAIKVVMDAYAEKTKQQAKSDAKQNSENQKPAYKNSVMNSLQKKYFQSYSIATGEEFAISPSVISAAEKLKSTWEELNRLNKEIGNTKPTEAQEIAFNRLTDEFNQAKKELDGIISSTRKLSEKSLGTFNLFDAEGKSEFDLTDIDDRKKALLEAVNILSEGKAKIGEFDTAHKELSYTVKNADGNWVDMKASINAAGTAIEVVAGKTKSNTNAIGQFIDQLKSKFKSIAQYLISMAGYQEIIQQIRKGIQYVKEIDSALTELKKVTDETDETYAQFLKTMSQTGAEVGATISDLTNMAANWARLGSIIKSAPLCGNT